MFEYIVKTSVYVCLQRLEYLNGSSCNVIYVCEYVFEVLPVWSKSRFLKLQQRLVLTILIKVNLYC